MFATKAASLAGEAAALQEDNGTPRQSLALSNVNLGAFFDKLLRFFLQPAFLARRAAVRPRCGAWLWRHLAFRNWFQVLSWFLVHSRVSWADSDFKVRRGGTPRPAREARALPRHYVFA